MSWTVCIDSRRQQRCPDVFSTINWTKVKWIVLNCYNSRRRQWFPELFGSIREGDDASGKLTHVSQIVTCNLLVSTTMSWTVCVDSMSFETAMSWTICYVYLAFNWTGVKSVVLYYYDSMPRTVCVDLIRQRWCPGLFVMSLLRQIRTKVNGIVLGCYVCLYGCDTSESIWHLCWLWQHTFLQRGWTFALVITVADRAELYGPSWSCDDGQLTCLRGWFFFTLKC
jgi:hypothetical protein